jgi:hypothetical protein
MLRSGNIFVKFSQNGPPHDRWVWLSEDNQVIRWCDPEKKKKGILKGEEATIALEDISAISEGIKSEVGKHQKGSFMQSLRGFKASTSGINKLDQDCCLTILGGQRSLDLQAPSRMVRRDWLLALRLLLAIRQCDMDSATDRKRVREFVQPRSKPKATSSGPSQVWSNFFASRSRAESVAAGPMPSFRPGSLKGVKGERASPPPRGDSSGKLAAAGSFKEELREADESSPGLPPVTEKPAKKGFFGR